MKKTAFILMILSLLTLPICVCTAEDLVSGDFSYTILGDGTAEITGYTGTETEIGLPSAIDEIPVTAIGQNAFSWNSELRSVTIPEGVTAIGERAFAECTSLEKAELPGTLVSLGSGAFQGCEVLTEAALPAGLVRIGWNPFDRCSRIAAVSLPEENRYYTVQDGILYDRIDSKLVTYPAGMKNDTYTIPDWVTSIGLAAFSECPYLNEVTIPDRLTELSANPFCGCTALKKLNISGTHPVFEMGENALFNKLTRTLIAYLWTSWENSYKIPSGTAAVGQEAFYKHPELIAVSVPASVRTIGDAAFAQTGLISIVLPDSIISLGNSTFSNCSSLRSVRLPSRLTEIGESLFYKCTALHSVALPGSVRSIGAAAFYLCQSLTAIEIPDGTMSIGNFAFAGCVNLRSVTIPDSVISIGNDIFRSDEKIILKTGKGSYAEEWAKTNGIKQYEPPLLPSDMI